MQKLHFCAFYIFQKCKNPLFVNRIPTYTGPPRAENSKISKSAKSAFRKFCKFCKFRTENKRDFFKTAKIARLAQPKFLSKNAKIAKIFWNFFKFLEIFLNFFWMHKIFYKKIVFFKKKLNRDFQIWGPCFLRWFFYFIFFWKNFYFCENKIFLRDIFFEKK